MNNENNSKNIIIILLCIIIVLLIAGMAYILITNNQNNQNIQNSQNNYMATTSENINNNFEDTNIIDNSNTYNTTDTNSFESSIENTINTNAENTENTIVENIVNNTNQTTTEINSISDIKTAIVNGVKISVPATKDSFVGTGWEWDAKYANTDLATGYTTSGGRLGKYPGGAVINVINKSGQTKKIQDCTIDSITFYNPGDGSENVTFIGGINYTSSADTVKATFSKLGYKNVKERNYDESNYYTFYMNDNTSNYRDYIEFYYFKGSIKSVSIKSSVK